MARPAHRQSPHTNLMYVDQNENCMSAVDRQTSPFSTLPPKQPCSPEPPHPSPHPVASHPPRPPQSTAAHGEKGMATCGPDNSGGQESVTWLRLDDLQESPAGRGFVERLDGVREAHQVFRCVTECVQCCCCSSSALVGGATQTSSCQRDWRRNVRAKLLHSHCCVNTLHSRPQCYSIGTTTSSPAYGDIFNEHAWLRYSYDASVSTSTRFASM